MRIRPTLTLATLAVAALALAGCSSDQASPSAAPSGSTSTDLCAVAATPGAASDAVQVSGALGSPADATFDAGITVDGLQRTVVTEGNGAALADGDLLQYAFSAFDAATGQRLGDIGYGAQSALPEQVSASSAFGQLMGCATVGSRLVITLPASDSGGAQIYVFDLLGITPTAAWGEPQPATEGLPTVALDADGTPNITVDTAATPPSETQIATLKLGDGAVVTDDDKVLIQFRGARWSTGELFDGGDTWASAKPYAGAASGFVPGFTKALVGQTVGSQVLVVIPPVDGYGEGEINDADLKGETLVFVIDILAAAPAAQ